MGPITSKKCMVVNAIIGLVMAAIFILVGASVLNNFLAGFCRPEGAIVDATKVVCFGDGAGHYIHCLNKETGNEDFKLGAAPNWGKGADAKSTPTLTTSAIYSGLGQYFVSFMVAGTQNYCGEKMPHTILTGVAVDEANNLACFGGGADQTLHCQNTDGGDQRFKVYFDGNQKKCAWWSSDDKEVYASTKDITNNPDVWPKRQCRAMSTPAIVDNIVYFALGNKVCKISTNSNGDVKPGAGDCKSFDWTIPTGLAVDKDKGLVCFGGGKDHNMHCLNTDTLNREVDVHAPSSWALTEAKSTPLITADKIYFGIGNRFCAMDADEQGIIEANLIESGKVVGAWCKPFDHTISTSAAIDEDNDVVCFGGGADHTVHCLNAQNGNEKFYIHAGKWDKTNADSTPFIDGNKLFVAIGDKVCAFKLPVGGDKDFSDSVFKYSGDIDRLWAECADFEHQIATGIAGLPSG